jgi:hypothetical protein
MAGDAMSDPARQRYMVAEAAQSASDARARALLAERFGDDGAACIFRQGEAAWVRYGRALARENGAGRALQPANGRGAACALTGTPQKARKAAQGRSRGSSRAYPSGTGTTTRKAQAARAAPVRRGRR